MTKKKKKTIDVKIMHVCVSPCCQGDPSYYEIG